MRIGTPLLEPSPQQDEAAFEVVLHLGEPERAIEAEAAAVALVKRWVEGLPAAHGTVAESRVP